MKLFNRKQRKQLRTFFSIKKNEIKQASKEMLISLQEDKGFTFGSGDLTFFDMQEGYMVSLDVINIFSNVEETRLGLPIPKEQVNLCLIKDIIYDWLANVMENGQSLHDFVFLGGWEDTEANKVYFDYSLNYLSKRDALKVAKANNQKAIWDCAKAQEIRVK